MFTFSGKIGVLNPFLKPKKIEYLDIFFLISVNLLIKLSIKLININIRIEVIKHIINILNIFIKKLTFPFSSPEYVRKRGKKLYLFNLYFFSEIVQDIDSSDFDFDLEDNRYNKLYNYFISN